MKRSKLFFNGILLPLDYLMLVCAGFVVYVVRYNTFLTDVRPVMFEISPTEYVRIVALVAVCWIIIFAFAQLYTMRSTRTLIEEFRRVFLGCSAGFIAVVFLIFFRHELFGSRFLVLASWVAAIIFVFLGRVLVRVMQRTYFARGIGIERILLIGDDIYAHFLVKTLVADSSSGYKVVRHIKTLNDASWHMFENSIYKKNFDIILFASSEYDREIIADVARRAHEHHIEFMYVADTLAAKRRNVAINELGGMPIVHIKRTPLDGWGRILKRGVDIVLALCAIIMGLPIFMCAGIAVMLDGTNGPILVKLIRMGEAGKPFMLYKFRSMIPNAHALKETLVQYNERREGPLFKMKNDPRITTVGVFLRAWSIDELPNFFNVLKGDLSLVGPRPHEPNEVGKYVGEQKRLLNIKPGVTGLAQISGRSGISFDEEARLDLLYIENWSFWYDVQILIRTPWAVITGKNAV